MTDVYNHDEVMLHALSPLSLEKKKEGEDLKELYFNDDMDDDEYNEYISFVINELKKLKDILKKSKETFNGCMII